jgi:hypothetical protein
MVGYQGGDTKKGTGACVKDQHRNRKKIKILKTS